ncbi:MAG: xanthine phosphoribosyltransferase [Candidatus Obscuribacterales bacterium]|nr:xanthine phosphoribosyltransferase [Candidatus Obscuribacterales bacterium]
MQILLDRILKDGKVLASGILKVDSFMNHQIDPVLMKEIGIEFARIFSSTKPTRILTAESSGIAPALSTAMALEIPIVFARKNKPVTMAGAEYRESAPSHTHGGVVDLVVSSEYLNKDDRILILDDFLATANTLRALFRLAESSGARVVGIGAVIEKSFEGGRESLKSTGVLVESLAVIDRFEDNRVIFAAK